jgi:hypothetical protein
MRNLLLCCVLVFINISVFATEGALSGKFSVAEKKQVVFSQGNLQYQASTSTWRFATNQYDTIGADNANISESYSGWIDLFGWGTGNAPTKHSEAPGDYKEFHEWGTNAISNGGNAANLWRTLTIAEWYYLYDARSNYDALRGFATINDVRGYIFLPDDWTLPSGLSFDPDATNFTTNTYSVEQWAQMQIAGAVFLPTAGYRWEGIIINDVSLDGSYWSSSLDDTYNANAIEFYWDSETSQATFLTDEAYEISYGLSVRLVHDYEEPSAIDNTTVEAKAIKRVKDGHLLIEKNGKTYNAQGVELK